MLNQKQRSVEVHDFAMNPSGDVPRSQFDLSHGRTVPFSFSYLVPVLCEMVLPGDTWRARISVAARTAVPLVPVQDNWHLEFFSFFVPMRLTWTNAPKFWGEQNSPADSISYVIPQIISPAGGWATSSIYDYLGLPTTGQITGGLTTSINALPLRGYNLICDQWFRDENLQNTLKPLLGDGPDPTTDYVLQSRGKRFDYFTQALPWPQKGNTAVPLPIGGAAPVRTSASATVNGAQASLQWKDVVAGGGTGVGPLVSNPPNTQIGTLATGAVQFTVYPSNLYADNANSVGPSLNAFRTAVTLQQYLEKDARGGTRYTEYVWNHFKVRSPDARLQRPEFIGGGHAPILTTAIPQTSATGLTGGTTPAGYLAASGHVKGSAGFTYSATEHGYVYTLVSARADLRYQQGIRRMWTVQTRYDFPVPLLSGLGEQTILNKEIYADGSANDIAVFGYAPRWDEYRYIPSQIVGIYKSYAAGTIDYWHSAQRFTGLPTLNSTFIADDSKTVLQRNFTAGAATANQQILADFFFDVKVARALPVNGIPGLTRI